MLEAARWYIGTLGVPVFPLHTIRGGACTCGDVQCKSPGKHPRTPQGLHDASTDEKVIHDWWLRWPDANIGMPTGEKSLLFVLDVDLPDGERSLKALIDANGEMAEAPLSNTGSGGKQYFFSYPVDAEIRNSASKLAPNLDIRGEGGYVVLPPSLHISGRRYKWSDGKRPDEMGPVEAPAWLLKLLAELAAQPEPVMSGDAEGGIIEGRRNDTMYRMARSMRSRRMTKSATLAALLAENREKCRPPLSDNEIAEIVGNAYTQPHRVDFETQARKEDKISLPANDPLTIARKWADALVERPDGRILHHWDKEFWRWTGAAYRAVPKEDMRAEIWRWLGDNVLLYRDDKLVRPNTKTVNEVYDGLQAHVNIPQEMMHPPQWIGQSPMPTGGAHLVPVANGILDLEKESLQAPTPRFFNLNYIRADYQKEAIAPTWLEFLDAIWPGEPEQVETLQEIFGYLISGQMEQQKAFMIIGAIRSGKGTIARVLQALLGKEAVARVEVKQFAGSFGLENLVGKSLAILSDARIDSAAGDADTMIERLLTITGQDSLDVNRKYKSFWSGELNTRFLVLSNPIPRVMDTSGAFTNRFIVLQTRISFLGKEDPQLSAKLVAELPGILAWSVKGWQRLQKRGHFIQPESVGDLVDQFRSLSNPLSDFVAERCELDEKAETSLDDIYSVYLRWCDDENNSRYPVAKNVFARDLRAAYPHLRYMRQTFEGEKKRKLGGIKARYWGGEALS